MKKLQNYPLAIPQPVHEADTWHIRPAVTLNGLQDQF